MKTVRRRFGALALLTLCGGLAIAALVEQQATPIASEPAPAININQYLNLMAHRCNNLNALAQLLEDAQNTFLPILPPDPDFILTTHGALTPFDFNSLPEGFNIQLLIPGEAHGVAAVTLTLAMDPTTRETVFMNSAGDVLYKLPPAPGYDPYAWLRARWPGLFPSNFTDANTNQWLKNHDPSRIQLSLRLISSDDVVPYLQAVALAQSSNAAAQAMAAQQGRMAPMTMMMSSDPCSITNESDPFAVLSIQPDGSGGMTITWESCTGRVYAVEARADLLDTAGWVALASNAGVVGSMSWTDTEALLYPTRFYRVQRQFLNFCTVSNCVLTNFDFELPDWWKIQNGYPVTTPADAVATNGLTLLENVRLGINLVTQVVTPINAVVTGEYCRAELSKCGFDEFTNNPVKVYKQMTEQGESELCPGETNTTLIPHSFTIVYNPTITNFTISTNGEVFTGYDVDTFVTNSVTQLVASCSNTGILDHFTRTLFDEYTTALLTNLTVGALANGTWSNLDNSAFCGAIRDISPNERINTLQKLNYRIAFPSQTGVIYKVQWVEHTVFTNGSISDKYMTEMVPGQASTNSTVYHPLDIPSTYGTTTIVMVQTDLDVGDGAGGGPDGMLGDPEDGVYGYIPGERSGYPIISMTGTNLSPQPLKLVAMATGFDHVKFSIVIVSSNLGYCTDTKLPDATDPDFSFLASGYCSFTNVPVANGKAIADFYCKDYGGACCIKITYFNTTGAVDTSYLFIPRDIDRDGISDQWEENMVREWNTQYGTNITPSCTFFAPGDDKELKDPDGAGGLAPHADTGDGLTVFQEYRGYAFNSVPGWGGEENYRRLSPARKELLVEVDRSFDNQLQQAAATSNEVVSALETAKTAFLFSAGVKLYFNVDNIESPRAFFTNESGRIAYADGNYNTTSTNLFNRSQFVYLLFASQYGGPFAGVSSELWHGAIIDCNVIHSAVGGTNAASRFSDLYSITAAERFGETVTHELGHTVQCKGDIYLNESDPGLRVRLRPTYMPTENFGTWQINNVNTQCLAQILIGSGIIDLGMDLYASTNITLADVGASINAMTNKYEAFVTPAFAARKGWMLHSGDFQIYRFDDGSDSGTWSQIKVRIDVPCVMIYNESVERYKYVRFNNNIPFECYSNEIGAMNVKRNYSKANFP